VDKEINKRAKRGIRKTLPHRPLRLISGLGKGPKKIGKTGNAVKNRAKWGLIEIDRRGVIAGS